MITIIRFIRFIKIIGLICIIRIISTMSQSLFVQAWPGGFFGLLGVTGRKMVILEEAVCENR